MPNLKRLRTYPHVKDDEADGVDLSTPTVAIRSLVTLTPNAAGPGTGVSGLVPDVEKMLT